MKEFISAFRQKRDLTIEQFTNELEYPSKTSIMRLMRGEAGLRAMEIFASKLRRKYELTEQEDAELCRFLNISRCGSMEGVQEMERFLSFKMHESGSLFIEGCDSKCTDFEARYAKTTNLEIRLFNSLYTNVYSSLRKLIVTQDAKVIHFISEENYAVHTSHVINAILPIVYEKNYVGYTIPHNDVCSGCLNSNLAFVTFTSDDNEHHEEMVIFDRSDHGYALFVSANDFLMKVYSAVMKNCCSPGLKEIKKTYFKCSAMEDYIGYSKEYAELEKDCAHFIIKPDPCIALIPVPVLKAAFCDQCVNVDSSVVEALVSVYTNRFDNIRSKKSPTHYIMKRNAMWDFVKTGKTKDHFWGMRAYTREERIQILESMLAQAQDNKYFFLHFLKDDDLLQDIQIGLYEGKGMLVLSANTSFNLFKDHSQVLITQEDFLEQYRNYYLKVLIHDNVMEHREMIAQLQRMIKYCRD